MAMPCLKILFIRVYCTRQIFSIMCLVQSELTTQANTNRAGTMAGTIDLLLALL